MTSERDIADVLRDAFGPLDGTRIPGGCDKCDAYQVIEQHAPRVWVTTVYQKRSGVPA